MIFVVLVLINVNEELKGGDGKVWTTRDGPTDRWNGFGPICVSVNRPCSWPGHSGQPPDPAVTLFRKMTIT